MRLRSSSKKFLLTSRHSIFTGSLIRLVLIILFASIIVFSALAIRSRMNTLPPVSELYTDWNNENYASLHEKTSRILQVHPLNGEVLALHGFASYYLSLAETDTALTRDYLVESITTLRKAWLRVSSRERVSMAYILGKAYYQRGVFYADLALKYLDYAMNNGAEYRDIHEFRGLTAELLGDYRLAIASFSEALVHDPSDLLLFTLARNYSAVEDTVKAKQYLLETIRTTSDELLELKSRYELGMILHSEGNVEDAEKEFNAILEKDPNYADAHYGLGVVYESREDMILARASWRRALRLNPVHGKAREKLTL